jgi:hypothetical protein
MAITGVVDEFHMAIEGMQRTRACRRRSMHAVRIEGMAQELHVVISTLFQ